MGFKPVDTAIRFVVGPVIDASDFATEKTDLAYNAAGMDVDLIVEKTDGTTAKTDITLAAAGDNAWTAISHGYYSVHITAAQNAEEGIAYLVGKATGYLSFRSNSHSVVPTKIYNSFVAGTDNLEVDLTQWKGATAPDNTGDAFARLGAPVGASTSADIADVEGKVDDLEGRLTAGRASNLDNLDAAISTRSTLTASQAADQVWDELIAGHLGVGSCGAALNAAGSAGDPWSTAIPGAYGAGTAGKIVGDALDAAITTRAAAATALSTATWTGPRAAALDFLTGDAFARLGAPVGASISADIADVEGKVDDLEGRLTAGRASALDYLDAAITSRAAAATALSTATWTGPRAAALDNLDAAVTTRATPAQVNAEVLDVLSVDTWAQLPQAEPPDAPTIVQMAMLSYMGLNNESETTAAAWSLYDSTGVTILMKRTISDDGVTFYRGKIVTGP